MVDRSSLLICYYDGKTGGTQSTVAYAEKLGLEVKMRLIFIEFTQSLPNVFALRQTFFVKNPHLILKSMCI